MSRSCDVDTFSPSPPFLLQLQMWSCGYQNPNQVRPPVVDGPRRHRLTRYFYLALGDRASVLILAFGGQILSVSNNFVRNVLSYCIEIYPGYPKCQLSSGTLLLQPIGSKRRASIAHPVTLCWPSASDISARRAQVPIRLFHDGSGGNLSAPRIPETCNTRPAASRAWVPGMPPTPAGFAGSMRRCLMPACDACMPPFLGYEPRS